MSRYGLRLLSLVSAAAVLLTLAGCAMAPPTPTPTALPLAATATPRPRATRPPPTATDPAPPPEPATATPTPRALSQIDDLLARRTVEGFLEWLVKGEVEAAFRLYASDAARPELMERWLGTFTASTPVLVGAELEGMERSGPARYEAAARLTWSAGPKAAPTTQEMSLALVRERGLWRIEALGPAEAGAP